MDASHVVSDHHLSTREEGLQERRPAEVRRQEGNKRLNRDLQD